MNRGFLFQAFFTALSVMMISCAHLNPELAQVDQLIDSRRWMMARERLDRLLAEKPDAPGVRQRLEALQVEVEAQEESLDLNPIGYFYAEAYKDFFAGRYLSATQAMQQVMAYSLANEEVIEFMDRAQVHLAAELQKAKKDAAAAVARARWLQSMGRHKEAARSAQVALALEPSLAEAASLLALSKEALAVAAKARSASVESAVAAPAAVAADPQWVELRYREALRVYLQGDLSQAHSILSELADADAENAKVRRTLDRIEKELRKKA